MLFRKGIDLGNGYCKYSKGKRFASKVRQGTLQKAGNNVKQKAEVHEAIYKGNEYVVGEGSSFISEGRYYEESYKISLLTATALASGKRSGTLETSLVVGIPVDHYNSIGQEVEDYLNTWGVEEITVDGQPFTIIIKDVTVFIEGAYPILHNDDRHIITIDIGMGTINITEWKEQEIVDCYTNNGSFNEMYQELSKLWNHKHKTKLNPPDVERYIKKPELNTKTGTVSVEQDIEGAFTGMVSDLISFTPKIDYIGADAIKVFGGGAIDTFRFWKKQFPKAELVEDSQYINQEVYEAVAVSLDDEE